ncbi:VP2-like protein [Sulfolobus spindle-shaped virus 6]|uniref:VP2-like protein n=1 Tax=Sulfolobus spindle-shaped virus 6 TaxID=693627 RepID=D1GF19_9VIRU|nr:VP2-like protein [Sulfolobus spindle-shaped virus 6]ACZ35721.1 VP2-like protein [Sulfolobus spindle-shaped virus 6]
MKDRWIQKAVKKKGRVHRYLMKLYGKRAFTKDGDIKIEYLNKAIRHVKRTYSKGSEERKSLLSALLLAKRLKRMRK